MKWCSVWLAAWLCSACSVLVDPSSLVIKCEIGTTGKMRDDPCLTAGMHCINSECKPCEGETEICNGVDDDCDGVIDNGHDEDGDGFTWCGGGRAELADCAPDDPNIHPAGPVGPDVLVGSNARPVAAPDEACDGKDNDCDSKVDEDKKCEPMPMQTCDIVGCPSGRICDGATRVCIEPRPVGSGCQTDAECAGGFCIRKGSYTLEVELTDNRCASACCSDADCAAGSLCVGGDAGVRVCLPANIAARGSASADERCTRPTDCASGSCVNNRCVTRCTADTGCRNAVCALSDGGLNEARRWLCGDARGRGEAGSACLIAESCRSGYCRNGVCADVCGRDADCGADEACSYTSVRPVTVIGPTSVISLCVPQDDAVSSPLCCTNSDCETGKQCAPYAVTEGGQWTMACR